MRRTSAGRARPEFYGTTPTCGHALRESWFGIKPSNGARRCRGKSYSRTAEFSAFWKTLARRGPFTEDKALGLLGGTSENGLHSLQEIFRCQREVIKDGALHSAQSWRLTIPEFDDRTLAKLKDFGSDQRLMSCSYRIADHGQVNFMVLACFFDFFWGAYINYLIASLLQHALANVLQMRMARGYHHGFLICIRQAIFIAQWLRLCPFLDWRSGFPVQPGDYERCTDRGFQASDAIGRIRDEKERSIRKNLYPSLKSGWSQYACTGC